MLTVCFYLIMPQLFLFDFYLYNFVLGLYNPGQMSGYITCSFSASKVGKGLLTSVLAYIHFTYSLKGLAQAKII